MFEILNGCFEKIFFLQSSQFFVAGITQQTASTLFTTGLSRAARVVVINTQLSVVLLFTDGATIFLIAFSLFVLLWCQLMLS